MLNRFLAMSSCAWSIFCFKWYLIAFSRAFWLRIESFTSNVFFRNWRIFYDRLLLCIRRKNVRMHKNHIWRRYDKFCWRDRIFNNESITWVYTFFQNIRMFDESNRLTSRLWLNDSSTSRWRIWWWEMRILFSFSSFFYFTRFSQCSCLYVNWDFA